jgi:phosphoribosylformylglycinamidine (FGAM) synthase-like enzyme
VTLPTDAEPFVSLFSESAGRVLVSLSPKVESELVALAAEHDIPLTALGRVSGPANAELSVVGQFALPLDQIRKTWSATLPAVLAHH